MRKAALVLLAVIGTASAAASTQLLLKPRDRSDLKAFELVEPGPRSNRPIRQPGTDFALLLSAQDGAALRAANGTRPPKGRTLFRVRLLAVAAGRLLGDGIAGCGPWDRDLTRCEMACDGGSFHLRRGPEAGEEPEIDFVLGTLPHSDESESGDGLLLGDCSLDAEAAPRLAPRPDRALVELPLFGN